MPTASWIDRAVGDGQPVDYVYGAGDDPHVEASGLWQAEFWNRSLDDVYNIGIAPPYALIEKSAPLDRGNGRLEAARQPDRFAVAAERLGLAGTVVARHGPLALYRIDPPARVAQDARRRLRRRLDRRVGSNDPVPDSRKPARPSARQALSRGVDGARTCPDRSSCVSARSSCTMACPPSTGSPRPVNGLRHSGKSRVFTFQTPAPPYRLELGVMPTFSPSRLGAGDTRELGVQLDLRRVG